MNALTSIYADKDPGYFSEAREDIVAMLPTGPQSAILELGCGSGATGRAALEASKAGTYVGIELDPASAAIASMVLSKVLLGDAHEVDLRRLHGKFDALIASEVLEHLADPWSVLAKLTRCLKPGGVIFASVPNVAHWRVIVGLLKGRFRLSDHGVMDRTHLRWFTPESFREMFEAAGVDVEQIGSPTPFRWKARALSVLTAGRLDHLLATQVMVRGRLRPS